MDRTGHACRLLTQRLVSLGFSDSAFEYKFMGYCDLTDEGIILWSDRDLDILWPMANSVLTTKDLSTKRLVDLRL